MAGAGKKRDKPKALSWREKSPFTWEQGKRTKETQFKVQHKTITKNAGRFDADGTGNEVTGEGIIQGEEIVQKRGEVWEGVTDPDTVDFHHFLSFEFQLMWQIAKCFLHHTTSSVYY